MNLITTYFSIQTILVNVSQAAANQCLVIIPQQLNQVKMSILSVSVQTDLFWMLNYSDTAHSFCASTASPFRWFLRGSSQRIICLHPLYPHLLHQLTPWPLSHNMCNFPLFASCRPPGCQYQLHHQNSHTLCPQHVHSISLVSSPKYRACDVLIPDHLHRCPSSSVHYSYTTSLNLNLVWILSFRLTEPKIFTLQFFLVIWPNICAFYCTGTKYKAATAPSAPWDKAVLWPSYHMSSFTALSTSWSFA